MRQIAHHLGAEQVIGGTPPLQYRHWRLDALDIGFVAVSLQHHRGFEYAAGHLVLVIGDLWLATEIHRRPPSPRMRARQRYVFGLRPRIPATAETSNTSRRVGRALVAL